MQQSAWPSDNSRRNGPAPNRTLLERVLEALPEFSQLRRADFAALLADSRLLEARRGEAIVRRGDHIPGLIALAAGLVKVTLRRHNGEEKVLRLLGPGETFGLATTILARPCPVDVVALTRSAVAIVPPPSVQRLLESDGGTARSLMRALAERHLELVAEIDASVRHSGLQRLARYLESIAAPEPSGERLARLPATKTTIAARLGVKKETFSRMLHELSARGLIAVRGPEVAILDRESLVRLADLQD